MSETSQPYECNSKEHAIQTEVKEAKQLKRILNQIAIHTAGLLAIYAVVKQLGLTASIVLIGALALAYFTVETNESEAK